MELPRKRMHDLIEQAAQKKDVKSKWDLTPPKRPSAESIKAAQKKPITEEDYNLFDR
jgi:hypothetical protein